MVLALKAANYLRTYLGDVSHQFKFRKTEIIFKINNF